jgi:hypothetical protein
MRFNSLTPCSNAHLRGKLLFRSSRNSLNFNYIKFTIVLTTACHCSVFWARWIQSTTSHDVSVTRILIWASNRASHYANGLYPSEFPIKILNVCLLNPKCARCSAHFILLDFIILIQMINLLTSPSSCYLLSFRSNYSPQHLIPDHFQPMSLL